MSHTTLWLLKSLYSFLLCIGLIVWADKAVEAEDRIFVRKTAREVSLDLGEEMGRIQDRGLVIEADAISQGQSHLWKIEGDRDLHSEGETDLYPMTDEMVSYGKACSHLGFRIIVDMRRWIYERHDKGTLMKASHLLHHTCYITLVTLHLLHYTCYITLSHH